MVYATNWAGAPLSTEHAVFYRAFTNVEEKTSPTLLTIGGEC